jgi:DNA polymerase III epsilon subunit family exonuclease
MKLADHAKRLVSEMSFVAFDTETTGLGEARLVEVAAVKFKNGAVLDEFCTLVNPGCHIPSEVTAIHGITDRMVAHAPRASQALPQLVRFVDGAILMAHNASFDIKVLAAELYRSRLSIPDIDALDTCRLARRLLKGMPNYQLTTLSACLGFSQKPQHRALSDAHAVRDVFDRCLRALSSRPTLESVIRTNGAPYSFKKAITTSQVIDRSYRMSQSEASGAGPHHRRGRSSSIR